MSTFSTRLRARREERGLTRQQAAEALGLTVRAYQYYEEGKREPDFSKLLKLAELLETSTDYLLGRTDGPV